MLRSHRALEKTKIECNVGHVLHARSFSADSVIISGLLLQNSAVAPLRPMSCSQSGAGGPPFSPVTQQDESSLLLRLRRWLPWEWYSIDGSGWCYNAEWDRMQPCAEMDLPADWNGFGAAPTPPWFGAEERGLLVAVLLSGAVLMCYAFRLWAAARGASGAAAPEMRDWLHTAHAPPWAWEPGALLAAAGTLGGLLVGFLAPLALPTIRVTFESSG
jgi:hypothetical protein